MCCYQIHLNSQKLNMQFTVNENLPGTYFNIGSFRKKTASTNKTLIQF